MEYTIYTDGSAHGHLDGDGATKDTPAGWGFVVIEGPTGLNHNDGEETHSAFGRVITDTGHPLYIGAEIGSNNTAELSAVYNALEWIKSSGATSVTVYSDSQYALNMAFGDWRASTNKQLISKIRSYAKETMKVVSITHAHIRAHSGFKWNEVADRLADQGARR
jgi:ribonuclease HI